MAYAAGARGRKHPPAGRPGALARLLGEEWHVYATTLSGHAYAAKGAIARIGSIGKYPLVDISNRGKWAQKSPGGKRVRGER